MMEPYLVRFRGRCSVSNILTASGKRFEDPLPKLDEFPGGVCWLNSLALCPYGANCSFIAGHVPKGTLTDTHADKVVETMQGGITALLSAAQPEGGGSPTGRKMQRGGQGRGGGRPSPPPSGIIPM